MANSYFFTLLSFSLMSILAAALQAWQHLPFINTPVAFMLVFLVLLWPMIYGFTHVIKANKDAKFFSYLCGTLSLIATAVFAVITVFMAKIHSGAFLLMMALTVLFAINLMLTTRKKTKSYF